MVKHLPQSARNHRTAVRNIRRDIKKHRKTRERKKDEQDERKRS